MTAATEWTLATIRAAAEAVARARGLEVRAFITGGTRPAAVRIDVLREPTPGEYHDRPDNDDLISNHLTSQTRPIDLDTREVTCWLELPCEQLDAADAAPGAITELVEREVTSVLRMRHGQGAAA